MKQYLGADRKLGFKLSACTVPDSVTLVLKPQKEKLTARSEQLQKSVKMFC